MKETTMSKANEYPSRLGQMILIRLLAAGKPPARSDLDKAFRRYFAERLAMTSTAWAELLGGTLQELSAGGLIETKPFRLTDRGRRSALAQLGLESLPARCTWRMVKNRYLVAIALDIEPPSKNEWDRLSTADGLRGAVLAKHHGLHLSPVPTAAKALHALAWSQLVRTHEIEIPAGKEFTRNNVLGATLLSGRASSKPAETLAAMAVGASGSSPDRIRDAVICRWLDAQDESTVTLGRFDLRGFADRVTKLARHSDDGRFGTHKVFIANVWKQFQEAGAAASMTRAEFDSHLVEANREGLLTLSRADLVEVMEPDNVRLSEIRMPDATFHFVRTDY